MIDAVRERAELSALRSPEAYVSRLQGIVRNVCCKEAGGALGVRLGSRASGISALAGASYTRARPMRSWRL